MSSNTNTINTITCPIPGCDTNITTSSTSMVEHLRRRHQFIFGRLGLCSDPNTFVSICKVCSIYTKGYHHHCMECERPRYFHKHADLDAHLKEHHRKDFLESPCKHGISCSGFHLGKKSMRALPCNAANADASGSADAVESSTAEAVASFETTERRVCGFTHFDSKKFPRFASMTPGANYTESSDYVDDMHLCYGICKYDRPWMGTRCHDMNCSYAHYRGRIKWMIQMRNRQMRHVAVTHSADVDAEVPETLRVMSDTSPAESFESVNVNDETIIFTSPEHSQAELAVPPPPRLQRTVTTDLDQTHIDEVVRNLDSEFMTVINEESVVFTSPEHTYDEDIAPPPPQLQRSVTIDHSHMDEIVRNLDPNFITVVNDEYMLPFPPHVTPPPRSNKNSYEDEYDKPCYDRKHSADYASKYRR